MQDLVKGLKDVGIKYISSNLCSETNLNAPLNKQRQPHNYKNIGVPELLEIPSHGWQDAVFTKEKYFQFYGDNLPSSKEILTHYKNLLDKSDKLNLPFVNVALCLHPWAVMEYDSNLEIHKQLVDYAREKIFQ